jgi:hypothetical protein
MNKSSFKLSPGWHIPAALVLTYLIGFMSVEMASESVPRLQMAGHSALAGYYATIVVVIWCSALLILLPRNGNVSRFGFVRTLGRLNLFVRYFVASGVAVCLFLIGELLENFTS